VTFVGDETDSIDPDDILATVVDLRRRQKDHAVAAMLSGATGSLTEQGWSEDGTKLFHMAIRLPLATYALVEPSTDGYESSILAQVQAITRHIDWFRITRVVIVPEFARRADVEPPPAAPDAAGRLWLPDRPRFFISHIHDYKALAGDLKRSLEARGGSAFVAHDSIEPTKLWQSEIESALRSADAMVALLTPGFHESKWTDQEVGFALGRSLLVLPVKVGLDPYGFIGKWQAISAELDDTDALAGTIVGLTLGDPARSARMVEGLVRAVEQASSYANAWSATKLLRADAVVLSVAQAERLLAAIDLNGQVGNARSVPSGIKAIVARQHPGLLAHVA